MLTEGEGIKSTFHLFFFFFFYYPIFLNFIMAQLSIMGEHYYNYIEDKKMILDDLIIVV